MQKCRNLQTFAIKYKKKKITKIDYKTVLSNTRWCRFEVTNVRSEYDNYRLANPFSITQFSSK